VHLDLVDFKETQAFQALLDLLDRMVPQGQLVKLDFQARMVNQVKEDQ
jgi:hypothetical protein